VRQAVDEAMISISKKIRINYGRVLQARLSALAFFACSARQAKKSSDRASILHAVSFQFYEFVNNEIETVFNKKRQRISLTF